MGDKSSYTEHFILNATEGDEWDTAQTGHVVKEKGDSAESMQGGARWTLGEEIRVGWMPVLFKTVIPKARPIFTAALPGTGPEDLLQGSGPHIAVSK